MNLVLFTTNFPYGKGEIFLKDEISYASKFFKNIYIIVDKKLSNNPIYEVPKNAKCIMTKDLLPPKLAYRLFYYSCILIKNPEFIKYAIIDKKQDSKWPFVQILFAYMFSYIKGRELKATLHEIDKTDNTIYYSYWKNDAATFLARENHKLNGLCISRCHGYDCFYDRGFIAFRNLQYEGLDDIFANSNASRNELLQHCKDKYKNKILTSYLGLSSLDKYIDCWHQHDKFIIVTCSNIIKLKRIDLIIDALQITSFNKQCEWHHFGDGPLRESIINYANLKLNNKDNFSYFIHGFINNNKLHEFYNNKNIDIFINFSDTEGLGFSIIEAMAHGIPAIGRKIGGVPEIISNKNGIILNEKSNCKDLSTAIDTIQKMPNNKYIALRKEARKTVHKKFSAEKNYKEFYKTVLDFYERKKNTK